MLYIFVDKITPRCIYTFDFIFKSNNINYQLFENIEAFQSQESTKLNYSHSQIDNCIQIYPSTLLFDNGVKSYDINLAKFHDENCLAFDKKTDPLASIFFILTRLEEYNDLTKDEHQRFQSKSSIQSKFGLLNSLICDRLSKAIINYLYSKEIIKVPYQPQKLNLRPTFDIDNAFAFLHKGYNRRTLAIIKDLFNLNIKRIRERNLIYSGKQKDPYDTFDTILNIAQNYPVNVFWLLGDFSKYDRNINPKNKAQQDYIQKIDSKCVVGIHPSYLSNKSIEQLKKEQYRHISILQKPIKHSRQHFLKLNLPNTYQDLIQLGITNDYSMGYADEIGFRAGTLKAHNWYDLSKEEITDLIIHPFAYMDGTLLDYKHWTPQQAQEKIEQLYDEAKQFGGDFFFIWHNETIGNYGRWEGWKKVLEFTLNLK
ncbi:MAG: polysaccharide deacetylase family protein [Crocinitomicaceae bacterium]|nr:polysaccharide deacetylase family protein [Crocinitomicaceae bacterium]